MASAQHDYLRQWGSYGSGPGQFIEPQGCCLDAAGNPTPALLKKLAALGTDASAVPGLRRENDGKADILFRYSRTQS